ncbi:MAG: DUF5011 domain-containing protein [Firmicutes bacterium]|nr:DUF5011 domain-containing protein [Bacillota bacterium]
MKNNKILKIIGISLVSITILSLLLVGAYFLFLKQDKYDFKLKGKEEVIIEVFDKYEEKGYKFFINKQDVSNKIIVKGSVNTGVIGKYELSYIYEDKVYGKRIIEVVDTKKPEITLKGEKEISLIETSKYNELGALAIDNYDGDITDKIIIEGKVDTNKVGEYTIKYKIEDSSNNKNEVSRKIKVTEKPKEIVKNIIVEDNKSSIPQVPTQKSGEVNNITFTQNGIHVEGCTSENIKPTSVSLNNKLFRAEVTNNCYKSDIDLTTLENGDYTLYINNNDHYEKAINKLDTMLQIKRGKVGNKLVTFDYTNNNVNINISDFYYEYDVIIDVGHGGSDTGATNIYIAEKDMNLKVSLYEKQKFEEAGLKVLMIRTDDSYGSGMGPTSLKALNRRAYYMGYYGVASKVIYSNHHNASSNSKASGFEIYATNQMSDLSTEINIFNAVSGIKDTTKIKANAIYGRDYESGSLLNKTSGNVYNNKNYYAIHRIPSELFNLNKVVIYESCYISNIDDFINYWNNEAWKKISDIKVENYIKKIKSM